MRAVAISAAALAGVAVLALLSLVIFQRRLIYPAPVATIVAAPGFERVALHTTDGLALTALFRPPASGQPTIIFFHGNGDSLSGSLAATGGLATAGYGLLLPEYRGYGGNPGSPTEAGLYADAEAAAAFLRQHGIADRDTFAYGNSLGSGPATELATRRPLAGLILVSGYASLPEVIGGKFAPLPLAPLVRDRFDNRNKLMKADLPVLALHGDADAVVPEAQGAVFGAVGPNITYRVFPGVGHDLAYRPEAQAAITAWLGSQPRSR